MVKVLIGLLILFLTACDQPYGQFEASSELKKAPHEITHEDLKKDPPPPTEANPEEEAPEDDEFFLLSEFLEERGVCSGLGFDGVLWPRDLLPEPELRAYALALNISGSFEGHEGFRNISDNFDGQGISLGLLNQNLGQGSLQPLMIEAFTKHEGLLGRIFPPEHGESLEAMLRKWGEGKSLSVQSLDLSPLDKLSSPVNSKLSSRNSKSVNWAKDNLYNGGVFKSQWKQEMQSLAGSPEYIVEQMQKALRLHDRAIGYQRELGFNSLRSYLLFFDIAVQNGSLKNADIGDYKKYIDAGNENQSEETKLKKILELRLRHVLRRWRKDVQIRKTSIIEGQGVVHGARRNYQDEYCFDFEEEPVLNPLL